jgi:DNA mismatch endonuclease (patch repair protein)
MVSTVKPASPQRARLMASVRQQDTAPEMAVRRALHAQGLRYTLHERDLPGRPDIVLPKRRSVVFVHGCFWHGHDCKHGRAAPKFNVGFWAEKISTNRKRDRRQRDELRAAGWNVETVWECQIEQRGVIDRLAARLLRR